MTNFEYYKDQIWDIVVENNNILAVVNDKPGKCRGRDCDTCDLSTVNGPCTTSRYKWLCSEHIEKPTITQKERAFLELCRPGCYIARSSSDYLYIFESKPTKEYVSWYHGGSCMPLSHYRGVLFDMGNEEDIFPFIKWEDEEPWKVEDLLKLEVKG